ncbi:MAG: hypothetical protein AAFN44_20295 [Pseudomonadota bacterium]
MSILRHLAYFVCILAIAGCGRGAPQERTSQRLIVPAQVSYGPISKACIQSDRKKASRELCTCIQAAADKTLSRSDQRKSVAFYNNPHLAQQIRQSERSNDEKFWEAYAAYGEEAERMCG